MSVEKSLPSGWEKIVDSLSGREYYFNSTTQETSFEMPKIDSGADWAEMSDDSGRKYYYNVKTHETTWNRPLGVIRNASTSAPGSQSMYGVNSTSQAGNISQIDSDAALAAALAEEYHSNSQPVQRTSQGNHMSQMDADAALAASLAEEEYNSNNQPQSQAQQQSQSSPSSYSAFTLPEEPFHLPPIIIDNNEYAGCQVCQKEFTLTIRRHHCKCCGRLLCSTCSQYKSKVYDTSHGSKEKDKRVCLHCFDYLKNSIKDNIIRYMNYIQAYIEHKPVSFSSANVLTSNMNNFLRKNIDQNENKSFVNEDMCSLAFKGINNLLNLPVFQSNTFIIYSIEDYFNIFINLTLSSSSSSSLNDNLSQYLLSLFSLIANLSQQNSSTVTRLFAIISNNVFCQQLSKLYASLLSTNSKLNILTIFNLSALNQYVEIQNILSKSKLLDNLFDDILDFKDTNSLNYALTIIYFNIKNNLNNLNFMINSTHCKCIEKLLMLVQNDDKKIKEICLNIINIFCNYSIIGNSREVVINKIIHNKGVSSLNSILSQNEVGVDEKIIIIKIFKDICEVNSRVVQNYISLTYLLSLLSSLAASSNELSKGICELLSKLLNNEDTVRNFVSNQGIDILLYTIKTQTQNRVHSDVDNIVAFECLKKATSYEQLLKETLPKASIQTILQDINIILNTQQLNKTDKEIAVLVLSNVISASKNNDEIEGSSKEVEQVGETIKVVLKTLDLNNSLNESKNDSNEDQVIPTLHSLIIGSKSKSLKLDINDLNNIISKLSDFVNLKVCKNIIISMIFEIVCCLLSSYQRSYQNVTLSNSLNRSLIQFKPILYQNISSSVEELQFSSISLLLKLIKFNIEIEADQVLKDVCDVLLFHYNRSSTTREVKKNLLDAFTAISLKCSMSSINLQLIKEVLLFLSNSDDNMSNDHDHLMLESVLKLYEIEQLKETIESRYLQSVVDMLSSSDSMKGKVVKYTPFLLQVANSKSNVALTFLHLGGIGYLLELVVQNNGELSVRAELLKVLTTFVKCNYQVSKSLCQPEYADTLITLTSQLSIKESEQQTDMVTDFDRNIVLFFKSLIDTNASNIPENVSLELQNLYKTLSTSCTDLKEVLSSSVFKLSSNIQDLSFITEMLERESISEQLSGLQLLLKEDKQQGKFDLDSETLEIIVKCCYNLLNNSKERQERHNKDIFEVIEQAVIQLLSKILLQDSNKVVVFNIYSNLNNNYKESAAVEEKASILKYLNHEEYQNILIKRYANNDNLMKEYCLFVSNFIGCLLEPCTNVKERKAVLADCLLIKSTTFVDRVIRNLGDIYKSSNSDGTICHEVCVYQQILVFILCQENEKNLEVESLLQDNSSLIQAALKYYSSRPITLSFINFLHYLLQSNLSILSSKDGLSILEMLFTYGDKLENENQTSDTLYLLFIEISILNVVLNSLIQGVEAIICREIQISKIFDSLIKRFSTFAETSSLLLDDDLDVRSIFKQMTSVLLQVARSNYTLQRSISTAYLTFFDIEKRNMLLIYEEDLRNELSPTREYQQLLNLTLLLQFCNMQMFPVDVLSLYMPSILQCIKTGLQAAKLGRHHLICLDIVLTTSNRENKESIDGDVLSLCKDFVSKAFILRVAESGDLADYLCQVFAALIVIKQSEEDSEELTTFLTTFLQSLVKKVETLGKVSEFNSYIDLLLMILRDVEDCHSVSLHLMSAKVIKKLSGSINIVRNQEQLIYLFQNIVSLYCYQFENTIIKLADISTEERNTLTTILYKLTVDSDNIYISQRNRFEIKLLSVYLEITLSCTASLSGTRTSTKPPESKKNSKAKTKDARDIDSFFNAL